jgi:hypothetical protein
MNEEEVTVPVRAGQAYLIRAARGRRATHPDYTLRLSNDNPVFREGSGLGHADLLTELLVSPERRTGQQVQFSAWVQHRLRRRQAGRRTS